MKQFALPCCACSGCYGSQCRGPVPASGSWKPPAAVSCPLWRAHSPEGQAASSQSPPSHLQTPAGLGWQTSPRTSDAHTLQTSSAKTEGDTQSRGEGVKSGAPHYCNSLKHPTLLFSPRAGLWHQTVGSRKLLQTHEPQSAPRTSAFCWEAARSRTSHPPAALENTAGQRQIKGIFVCRFRYMQHVRTN